MTDGNVAIFSSQPRSNAIQSAVGVDKECLRKATRHFCLGRQENYIEMYSPRSDISAISSRRHKTWSICNSIL